MLILFTLGVLFAMYVIYSNNIVYSLLCLVMVFLLSGIILLSLRIEFLGYMLIIVYVGAIAILFLFVVMTLDITREAQKSVMIQSIGNPLVHLTGILYTVMVIYLTISVFSSESRLMENFSPMPIGGLTNQVLLADSLNPITIYLYSTHFLYMMVAGFLLLVAMVGAVLLTKEDDTKKETKPINQNSQKQQYQSPKKAVVSNK